MFHFQFLLITAITGVVVNANSTSEYDNIERVGYVQTLFIEGLGDWGGEYFETSKEEIAEAKEQAFQCLADIKISSTFCDTFVNYFAKCVNPIVKILERSKNVRDREAPKALIMSLISLAKYFCNTDGEHLLELFNPCVFETVITEKKCYDKYKPKFDAIANSVSSVVPSFCEATTEARLCLLPKVEAQCPNKITKDAVTDTVHALMKPCKDIL